MATTNYSRLSRRCFCLCCISSAMLAGSTRWLTPREVFAQARNIVEGFRAEAGKAPVTVRALRGNVSVLEGWGGNIAVLTGHEGRLLVDAGMTATQPRIIEALTSLGPDPVRHLINTHWHFDHTDGNEWLHEAGATILAHENTRTHLASAQRVDDWNHDFPPAPAGAVPADTLATERSLEFNGATVRLKYYGPAHTDGDVSVTFAEADVLHTGDTFWNGIYPFIDYSTGGSIDGMIRAAESNLAAATQETIVIAGHGPIGDRAQLQGYRDMLVQVRDAVAALKKQGHSIDDAVAANPTAAFDARWGGAVIDPGFFTRLVYKGV